MTTASRVLESRQVRYGDETTIHYTVSGPADGPVMVLIHGWACDRRDYDEISAHLPRDLRVVAVDLAEHGESRSTRTSYSMAAFAGDVVAVLEAEDVSDAIVVGHSLGGAVAVEVALAAPVRVARVIALDALHYTFLFGALDDAQADAFLTLLRDDFPGLVRSMVEAGSPEGTDEALKDAYFAKMVAVRQPAGSAAYEGLVRWDMEKALAAVTRPVTVYAVREMLNPESVAHLEGRVEAVVPIDLGSHHFGVENPTGTAALLAAVAAR
ncbi:alpha/beta fold hydrolase [Pseudonocardia sp. WMMC193]|uniref:alpha/beta fold hydrolase n=1 Tax=Pseudonocardia sp. WMMC193 TaxID=2911965 RepID=UPI001F2C2D9F|nr:alpha/beta hydrolase [Pseudonocardia sp. WMMC193]MCF7553686.1 alpha/beta fold hydrolase [Pseudonocardia sp. WMMC193]